MAFLVLTDSEVTLRDLAVLLKSIHFFERSHLLVKLLLYFHTCSLEVKLVRISYNSHSHSEVVINFVDLGLEELSDLLVYDLLHL